MREGRGSRRRKYEKVKGKTWRTMDKDRDKEEERRGRRIGEGGGGVGGMGELDGVRGSVN